MARRDYDLLISGAGPVGLAAALAAQREFGSYFRVAICDPAWRRKSTSIRTYAISSASRNLLERICVWKILQTAQPIWKMEITDSLLEDVLRPTFLEFSTRTDSSKPLGFMISHDELVTGLEAAIEGSDVDIITEAIESINHTPASTSVAIGGGRTLRTGLIVACDGGDSLTRELAGIPILRRDYDRESIVATIAISKEHEGRAIQHFLPAGTFALLPMPGKRFSVVWVEKPADARKLCELSKEQFLEELCLRAGNAFGNIDLIDGPVRNPLRIQVARRFSSHRIALAGDAAHMMHPLAGQGLNLGLSDVAHLLQALADHAKLGGDAGAMEGLETYERSRHFETAKLLGITDILFNLFTSPAQPIRNIRDFGLGLVNGADALKAYLSKELSDPDVESPELLRPEALVTNTGF